VVYGRFACAITAAPAPISPANAGRPLVSLAHDHARIVEPSDRDLCRVCHADAPFSAERGGARRLLGRRRSRARF
jgi:hypothetical protein